METRQNSLRERCDSPGAVTRRRRLLFGAKATCELGIAPLASAARLVAACGFLAALTAFPVRARAATFTVNSTADVVDTFPGDGFCDDGSGYCTLRAAIMESNFTSAGDTIDFDATISGSPITLVIPPDGTPDDAADGDLDITEDLTINGAGAATTIIDGAALDRVFHVLSGTVTISGVTIQGGTAVQGGGIYNVGDLTLTDTSVRTNTSGLQGGGIYSGGALTLYSSDVIGNTSQQGGGIFISACGPNFCGVAILNSSNVISNFASSSGGGIFNALAADTTLNSSTIHANSTSGSGGGIFNALAATATLNSSEVSGSSADTGGGIYDNGGTLILNSSTVILNTATASYGGGIYNQGSMTLTDTTVQDNSTLGSDLVGGGGGIYNQGPMTLTNTTVSGNATLGRGGGIYNLDQTLTLTNSTISENDGRNGGGIFNRYGTVSLTHVTDSHNIATDYAGGIWNYDGTMELTNTIVSDNTAFTASDNCRGVIASLGHNMDSDNTCGLNLLSDLPGVFPHLVPLALNAPGSTKTHALCTGLNTPVWQCMAASPAIDAVPTTDCTVATDQRGITRPQGPACDIGAFEGERCTSAPAGMVAWWTLDELTGGTATDIVGGHNGTHVNGPAPLAGQYVDNSLCFSGNSYVDVPSPGLNVGEDDFSIDAWVKRDPASTNSPPSVIVDKRDSVSAIGYALSVSYGRLVLTMSGTNFVTTTSPVPADGLWHLVAVTVHRDTNGGLFYIDGNPLPGDTFTPLLGNLDNANVFRIGAGLLGTNQPWVGCVDELELFNRALSPDEVAAIFEARQAGKCKCVVDPPAVDIQTVSVGNPGNAEDTEGDGYGGVDYVYNIGKHEVTAGQYTEFLNAVADEDTYGLYNEEMWSHEYGCKIERTGSSPNYCYSVGAEWADRPVNFVSWGDAARFANWLRNGQPTGPQGPNTTEDGSYFLNGATSDAGLIAVVRELDATWVIPSEDEWYKAAYHYNDGVTGNYWDYPTSSISIPVSEACPGGSNSANYYGSGWAIGSPFYRTEVGCYVGSASPYGTLDQGGNVAEWNEAVLDVSLRGLRGGSFGSYYNYLHAANYNIAFPTYEDGHFGFRVAEKVLVGACCYEWPPYDNLMCTVTTQQGCQQDWGQYNSVFQGVGTSCPQEVGRTATHNGVVITHLTNSARDCPFGPSRGVECIPGDPIDAWTSAPGELCHRFGLSAAECSPEPANCSPEIPAGFFGPGSNPFGGTVCLKGVPIGPISLPGYPDSLDFGEADTLVKRSGDPFDPCDLPSDTEENIDVEIVALSLKSIDPITVTFNGGQNPEQWDVTVDLSPTVIPPFGTITAVKTHCNGGTYTSELYVQPRFIFTKVADPNESVELDTGAAGIPHVTLTQDDDPPWTSDVSDTLGLSSPICTNFHPGIEDTDPPTECECIGPQPAPDARRKNRYISFMPNNIVGQTVELEVTLTDSLPHPGLVGSSWWVQEPVAPGNPLLPPGECVALLGPQATAADLDWANSGCTVLHVTGCPIEPTSDYDVRAVAGANVSDPLAVSTILRPGGGKFWGDTVGIFNGVEWTPPNLTTNIDDAVAVIKTWQGGPVVAPVAGVNVAHLSVADVEPGDINTVVNFNDVFTVILAFQGDQYPFGPADADGNCP